MELGIDIVGEISQVQKDTFSYLASYVNWVHKNRRRNIWGNERDQWKGGDDGWGRAEGGRLLAKYNDTDVRGVQGF